MKKGIFFALASFAMLTAAFALPSNAQAAAKSISTCKISLSKTIYKYDGKAKRPSVTVKNKKGKKLTEGIAYKVRYSNNNAVGIGKVTVKGINKYKGKVIKKIKIRPANGNITRIYRFLKKKGFDKLHTAAIMGVMYYESNLDPTSIETVYNEPLTIGPKKSAIIKAAFAPSASAVKGYDKTYPTIKKLGIGLAGWTDTTTGASWNSQLTTYAKSRGESWYALNTQLHFWWITVSKSANTSYNKGKSASQQIAYAFWRRIHNYDHFANTKTLADACESYMIGYEGIFSESSHKLRTAKAKEFYKQIGAGLYD